MGKGGPTTEGGKEVVRWNATRHGIRSPAPVIPGLEKAEDWEEHRSGVLESLSPEGHLENVLAERVALLSWRLHRVTRYERESIALSQERVEEDLASQRRGFDSEMYRHEHLDEARNAYEFTSNTERLLKRLPTLPDGEYLSAEDASSILRAVWRQAGEEAALEEIDIPRIPEPLDPETLEKYDVCWTVGVVKEGIAAMASSTGGEPEKLLQAATSAAYGQFRHAKYELEAVERYLKELDRDLKNMGRERLLPDEKTLEKIVRYEAHLSRQLYQAMHELEALQTKRAGEAAPLARLDVQGLES